ncbi:serine/threonine-protein kinase ATM [Drosophila sulfurigaster albostrigata]|uniref:serine/threonine-protein kinase ATM n=1 Tax=Drosophila sulfurigaster albostrigata TaxID=89887 RepID=UPI002D21A4C4|nr:serine/threonine-protein kinase ATM [Drosophila sulfurigaster albostrigata]
MSDLLNELQRLISELRSDKPTSRNKAMELLDNKMNSSRDVLYETFALSQDLCFSDLFQAVKDSILKHAGNIQEAREKTYKTLADKCYLYGNVIDKIIDYNLEVGRERKGHFLSKSVIFFAFEEGIKQRIVVKHFGDHFINMIDRGIYLSPTYVSNLKVNEYSRILSYLFELNIENNEFLRSKILKCITKTVQIARERVQLHADIADYLPTLIDYADEAKNPDQRQEIVRLYRLFLEELSVNYHHQLCIYMQEILPKFCEYHNNDTFRDDSKHIFFECVALSLHALYPKLNTLDFNTFQVAIHESWPQTMQKLKTIIGMEIRKNSLGRGKLTPLSDRFNANFIKMSALVMYILHWHIEQTPASDDVPSKRVKVDYMERIVESIESKETSFNDTWFAIFAQMLQLSTAIVNVANYELALKTTRDVLLIYGNGENLRNVRLCLLSILSKEQQLLRTQSISTDYLADVWSQIAGHLITDSRQVADVVVEKQIMLQALIRHNKLSSKHCASLLQSIQANEFLRRNECISTIREIFIHADNCGLDKTSTAALEPIVKWAYGSEKVSAMQMIHNIAAIDAKLLADTFTIGIINFLDEQQLQQLNSRVELPATDENLQLLQYKYNKQLICLDAQFQSRLKCAAKSQNPAELPSAKNCLFQHNYELLMRSLNLTASNEHTATDLLKNLKSLHKLICTMERLLHYKVFDADNLLQCPLIKRIGLFLSHIEFQYKAHQTERLDDNDLHDILAQQADILDVFNSNEILLNYLEKQPIEMLLEFIGLLLKHNCTRRDSIELIKQCLHILGRLCANSSYSTDAFRHLTSNFQQSQHFGCTEIVLIVKLLCSCKRLSPDAIEWLVDQIKWVFKHHYTQIDIVSQLVEQLPTIFHFVYDNENLLDDMMLALMSLLKLSLKKSYPTQLAAKVLHCVADVAQRCPNIFLLENFAVICTSVAKFLSMPTLEVRLAATTTVTLLLNADYCVTEDYEDEMFMETRGEQYLEFCEQLLASIEWEKFQFNSEDLLQNSNAVAVQSLVSFFAYSSFHQETVLLQLMQHCAKCNLHESDFCAFDSVVPAYKQSMRQLMMPYADAMLHKCCAELMSTDSFPYYLCYKSKKAFLEQHAKSLMAYTFIYGTPEDIKRHQAYLDSDVVDILKAYDMLRQCDELNTSAACKKNLDNLAVNIHKYRVNLKDTELSASTLYCTVRMLLDKKELERLFDAQVLCKASPTWYSLTAPPLFNCLRSHMQSDDRSGNIRLQAVVQGMLQKPLLMVDLLSMLKTDCYEALLPSQLLRSFFLYCIIADAMLDGIRDDILLNSGTHRYKRLQYENGAYFVQDIWFFVCRLLLHTKCEQLQRAGLKFLHLIIGKHTIDYLTDYMRVNDFVKLLRSICQHVETSHLQKLAAKVEQTFVESQSEYIDMETPLEVNSDFNQRFGNLEQQKNESQLPDIGNCSVSRYMASYMKPNRSAGCLPGLRDYLAKHKQQLAAEQHLLFHFISRLIHMVRHAEKPEHSLEALRCLAEIGPLKMQHISYYFQGEFDAFEESNGEPMEQFISAMLRVLDQQLFHFKTSTQQALIQVIGHVVNSSARIDTSLYSNLCVFCVPSKRTSFLQSDTNIPAIPWLDLLQGSEHLDYEAWMCAFMCKVFETCGWTDFDTFAGNSFSFAYACLQPFIKLLMANKTAHLDSLCAMLDHFFAQHCALASGIYQEKRAIKLFLYICERIRLINNWTIPIDFGNAIEASNHCQAYFLSILYLELWACSASERPDADILANDSFQKSAKKAYESIGCLDAMTGFLNPLRSRVDYLSLNNNLFGCWLESDHLDKPNGEMIVSIMKSNGMLALADLQQRCLPGNQLDYEILWRLTQWDEPVDVQRRNSRSITTNNLELEFSKQHYLALKSINNREEENTMSAINNAYDCIREVLRGISVECLQSVYKYMTWLSTLQQAEDFAKIQFCPTLSSEQIKETFDKWQTELELTYGNFNCKEHVLSHQVALLKMAGTRATRRIEQYYLKSPVDTYLLKAINECKNAGKLNLATKYIATLRSMPDIKLVSKISVLLEDAEVQMRTGNHQIAKATLQHVLSHSEFQYCLQRVPAMLMQGEFLLNSNAARFNDVLEQNFQRATVFLNQFAEHKETLKTKYPNHFAWSTFGKFQNDNRKAAHAVMAKYADLEYQKMHNYRNSQEYKMLSEIIKQNRELAGTVKTRDDRDLRVGALNMNRFAALDHNALKRINESLTEHLCTAIEHYIAYCQLDGGASSAEIYRIIALWFTNESNTSMLAKIRDKIAQVPSYKFICALNQMVGRLSSTNAEFRALLVELLVRCGKEHPQQTFYKLYPLVCAHMDGNNSNTQRAEIAKGIIAQICNGETTVANCNRQFAAMFPALIDFSNTYLKLNPSGRQPTAYRVPEKLRHLSSLELDLLQCPTLPLAPRADQHYQLTSIVKWSEEFTLCNGINAPIKVLCCCSDGVKRPQLIKGRDDLRQDAVMQQVFGLVNELVNTDSECINRKLQLRTYQVTPLSMRSGILEWCSDTIPLGVYLVGSDSKSGAHMRYRPQDWTNAKCRHTLHAAMQKTVVERRAIYKHICEKVKPVLHYFLFEKFNTPGVWFERRLAYINSVAITSMVGYVLGLGDRHVQNILIDEQTAEVVHIDFGIAFEQGKIQTTPETVPFRLTRDIVAPMGVCGTNGVFTKSCEAVMHILRRYKPVLMTILEVLLYDPLFIWGVLSNQPTNEESKNLLAQRALLLVQHKLEGRESGILDNTSVETQVQHLINEARQPSNLALVFPGWDPYL